MSGEQLSADDAWHTVRRHGLRPPARQPRSSASGTATGSATPARSAAARARHGAAGHRRRRAGHGARARVVRRGRRAHRRGDLAGQQRRAGGRRRRGRSDEGSERARSSSRSGLATAFVAATSAFAQLERGANRIYGTKRDRPALRKYGCAALLTATAGVAMAVGLLLIVAGEPFGEAMEQVYRWGDAAETWSGTSLRWPVGLAALVRRGHGAVPARARGASSRG